MKKLLSVSALFSSLLLASPSVLAWDGAMTGKLADIDVAMPGNNYGLRIMLAGYPTMCTGGTTWAYLNEADSNYKTFLAVLLFAKAQGSTVTIYTTTVDTMCHVGHISVS